MTVITSQTMTGRRPGPCPICGAADSRCGGPTESIGQPARTREHLRRRTGRMMIVDGIRVPVYAKDAPEDVDTKKRTGRDKKVHPPGPADPTTGRPVPKIRTK